MARIGLLPLLLAAIIALFSFTGCASSEEAAPAAELPEGLSQQQIEQLLADATTNFGQLNTYKFDMDMDMYAEQIGGLEAGGTSMYFKIAGGINMASRQMQMNIEMSTGDLGLGVENIYAEMYLLSDWVYMKMDIPGMGEQWMKMPATDELNDMFSTEVIDQQMGMIESPIEVEYVRTESVDGIDCYVLSITPNMEELMQWMNLQSAVSGDIDWDEVSDMYDLFKKLSYVCYITKDTTMMKKMVIEMQMEFTPDQVNEYTADFEKGTVEFKIGMNLYDHDQPFSVTLPAEAENAMEVPAGML